MQKEKITYGICNVKNNLYVNYYDSNRVYMSPDTEYMVNFTSLGNAIKYLVELNIIVNKCYYINGAYSYNIQEFKICTKTTLVKTEICDTKEITKKLEIVQLSQSISDKISSLNIKNLPIDKLQQLQIALNEIS